jgi:transcriptional regulator with XRE-family HTH domain
MIDKEAAEAAFEPFRQWLVQRRADLKLTKAEVARRMGLRRPEHLTAWELGLRVPTIMWLARWCEALMADLIITPWEAAA